MPLMIKYSGRRPASVGGLSVPWKQWDKDPVATQRLVQLVAHAPEMKTALQAVATSQEPYQRYLPDTVLHQVRTLLRFVS